MSRLMKAITAYALSLAAAAPYYGPRFLHETGMRSGRGKGGKTAHRHTGIRAQKRAALKARNRARA